MCRPHVDRVCDDRTGRHDQRHGRDDSVTGPHHPHHEHHRREHATRVLGRDHDHPHPDEPEACEPDERERPPDEQQRPRHETDERTHHRDDTERIVVAEHREQRRTDRREGHDHVHRRAAVPSDPVTHADTLRRWCAVGHGTTVRSRPDHDPAGCSADRRSGPVRGERSRAHDRRMLTSLGHLTVRRRRWVLTLTVVFVVVAGALGSGAFGVLQDGGFDDPSSDSVRAQDLLDDAGVAGEPEVVLVARSADGDADSELAVGAAADLVTSLRAVDGIEAVTSYWELGSPPPLRSTDGSAALVLVDVTADETRAEAALGELRSIVGDLDGLTVEVGGRDAIFDDIGTTIESDLGRAELIAIPITLLLLIVVFGGLVAASLPLLVGVLAVMGTFLSLFVIGSVTDVSIYAINLTTALGLGLAIDYSLFVVSRYREELRAGRSVEDAVVRTVETAGRTVLVSALTVAVSLSALLLFPQYFLRSFAYAGVAVVLLAMAATLITLPSLLAVIGHRIDRLRILPTRPERTVEEGFWYRNTLRIMRRPLPVAIGVTVILLVLGAPFLRVEFGSPDDRVLADSAGSRVASETLRSEFEGNAASAFPVVLPGATDPADVDEVIAGIARLDGVARVEASALGSTGAWLSVVPTVEPLSGAGERLVQQIRGLDTPTEVVVGGEAASLIDTRSSIADRLPLAIGFIVLATFVLLFLLSGSVLVPVKALVLNALSLTATFGAMVWIFQDGNLSGLLDITATGALDTSMPILMFCIAFGLSMDYEVFLLSRIKEEHDRGEPNERAVALGLERTGRIVTAAAMLLSVTFFAFGTSGVSFIKMFGIGLAIAVLMDAFVVRGTLVPAFMKLAGDANWWAPAPLRRFHDRFGLHESEPAAPTPGRPVADDRPLVGTGV
jgi:putative drug exporter of the RND superfamily